MKSFLKDFLGYLNRKAVKVFANGLKPFFSLHYRIWPHKRYQIPEFSPASRKVKKSCPIPFIVWQTNYTDKVTFPVYINFLFNRFLTPEFDYYYFSDQKCNEFVKENFSVEIFDAFSRLQVGAARSDLWRILVLLKHGGIYLDMDSNFVCRPASYFDGERTEIFIRAQGHAVTNYFIASAPGSEVLNEVLKETLKNISENTLQSVFDMTGPTVLDKVVSKYSTLYIEDKRNICLQGQFTSKKYQYADKKDGSWREEQAIKGILK